MATQFDAVEQDSNVTTKSLRDEIRQKLREHSRARRQLMVPPLPHPRYDEVYFAGVAWLDRMARGEEQD